jgi:3-isopropylmalate/(R)-2-methylmalate dehydratase large subunit
MGQTLTEKIIANHAGRDHVRPGENVWVDTDILMTHDVCGPGTIGIFKKHFGPNAKVFDREKVVIIPDHYIFTADLHAHRNIEILRNFVREQNLKYFYDPDFVKAEGFPSPYLDPTKTNYKGVCHIALPEEGHTRPGEILLGTDSHTCTAGAFGEFATGIGNTDAGFVLGTGKTWLRVPETMKFVLHGKLPPYAMAKDIILHIIGDIGVDGATYRAMEYDGEGVFSLSVEERMTICNMAIEAGGKNGIIPADELTENFVRARTTKPFVSLRSDHDAGYHSVREYDLSKLEPTVAKPHSPDNRGLAHELRDVKLTRAYIGSCTGGKIEDFEAAARILDGQSVSVATFVVPATTEVDSELDHRKVNGRTLREIFTAAGAKTGPASCAACLGGPADTFGRLNGPEVCISTTNRNFPGRMGAKTAQVFLASPYTVAASAIKGYIADPRDYLC